MPNNTYFGYHNQPNPNIIVVPTVSFSPPHTGTKRLADPKTSSPTLNREQITPAKDNIGGPCALPCRSNCNQQNLPVVSSNTSTSTKFSDNFTNSLCVTQEKISTETLAFNKSQSIQDLSTPTPKYKPRHNLVDLTGFNIPKREKERVCTSSLLKHKDLRLIDDPKIEQDKMTTSYNENEHQDYSDSDNYKTDNISKSATNAKPTSTYSERNTENLTRGEPKTDMEVKMKKYFKQLWKRSFERIKAKGAKEKHVRAVKSSSKTTEEYKDSKEESSRGKAYLQKVSNSNSTKDLRNKIKESSRSKVNLQNVSNSNPTKDLRNKIIERRFMAKYTKRSKSETNFRHLPDSKVSIRDRRIDLSPDSIKRYKKFQHFMRHSDDHEIKYKSRNPIKTENLPRKNIRRKSCETTTNNPVSKNNVDERKKSIKSEKRSKVNTNQTNSESVENYTDMKRAIDQNNTDRVKLMKSVVRVNKNFHNNLSQRKRVRSCSPDGVEDLRLRLSRKRARTKYLGHYHEPIENTLVQESPMITVNQDVQADSKNSPTLAPTVNKPKLKKCKEIKIFVTIVCPISDSDSVNSNQDLNESCLSPEDVSSLEDFNDSVNSNQDLNESCSSPEDVRYIYINNTKKCKDEQNMNENIKVDRNTKQEANNVTDLTGNSYKENVPKETINLCKVIQNIKTNSKVDRNTKQDVSFLEDFNDSVNSNQDLNESCSSPEDVSFLEDFNYDEIVDSLNIGQDKPNKSITTDQTKPKEGIINDVNMKAIEITKKYETSSHKGQVIEISSDTVDDNMNIKIGSVNNTKECKDEQNMDENIKVDRNTKQEANNVTDLTGNSYKENVPKESINLCKIIQNIKTNSKVDRNTKQVANYIIDLTGKGYEEITPKEAMDLCKDEQNIQTNTKVDRNTKQEANDITDLIRKGYKKSAPKETMNLCKNEQNIKTKLKVDRNTKQVANNKTDLNRKYCDKNAAKETINLSNDDSVVEVIDITDENGHYTNSKHLRPKKPIQTSTLIKKANLAKSKYQFKQSVNKKVHNTKYEDKTNINAKQKLNPTNITDIKQTACLQTMFNIEQNKSINSIGVRSDVIKQLNTLDKQVKGKNVNSHNSEDTIEASLKTMSNNFEQNGSIRKQIKQNKINRCDENVKENSIQESVDAVAVEVSLKTTLFNSNKCQDTGINMDMEQPSSGQHIQKEIDVLQTAQVMTKVPLEMSNIVNQNKNFNEKKIELPNVTDKDIKIESETQKPGTQILPETIKNGIEQNDEIKINSKPLNVIKENCLRKSGSISKNSLETEENILEKANNKMDIICRSSKNVKEHLQTLEDTVNKLQDKPINKIEKKTNDVISLPQSKNKLPFDSGKSTKGILETPKSFAENCPSSSSTHIRPQSSLGQNNKSKGEPLLKSVETIKTSSKATIDNSKQKIDIRSESNKSDKNIEEKTLLTLQNSEVKSEKLPERSNIQHMTNVTTSVELTNPDKNIEVTSRKTSSVKAENSLMANNKETTPRASKKSNVDNQTKSETEKNNTQKIEIIDDACDLNKITIKDSELGKRSEIATNNKTKQEQVVSNKTLFRDGSKNNDENKSNKQAEIFTPPNQNFVTNFESQTSEYLQKKYSISSVIHNGSFSTVYKCFDNKGNPYAVKVVKQLKRGMTMERMLFVLQKYRPKHDYFVLYLISGLEVENKWCLLTEYYPVNLKQALHGYAHGFNINRVKVLSRQLVDAVSMLTNAGVIHSDIKPSHILLNSAHDRLKLCGFDQSNYSSCINITPNTGTLIYRAPEVILGFQEDHRIDLWSTALVMFEMATNKTLFTGGSNNVILYQQLCTFGSINYPMLAQSRFAELYFYGSSFMQELNYKKYKQTHVVNCLQRNYNLSRILFQRYRERGQHMGKWQRWNIKHKLDLLHRLLEQMLVLDPRDRLPIQLVGASEFMNN